MALPTKEILARYDAEQRAELSPEERLPPELREILPDLLAADTTYVLHPSFRNNGRRLQSREDIDEHFIDAPEPPPEKPVQEVDYDNPSLARVPHAPLLGRELERFLFLKMNYCFFRASQLQARIRSGNYSSIDVADLQYYLNIAQATERRIVEANHPLSIIAGDRITFERGKAHEWSIGDFVSEGYPVLCRCVRKMDVRSDCKFASFAGESLLNHFRNLMRVGGLRSHGKAEQFHALPCDPDELMNAVMTRTFGLLLDPIQREVLTLRLRGMSLRRIGVAMGGMSKDSVDHAVRRGTEALHSWFQRSGLSYEDLTVPVSPATSTRPIIPAPPPGISEKLVVLRRGRNRRLDEELEQCCGQLSDIVHYIEVLHRETMAYLFSDDECKALIMRFRGDQYRAIGGALGRSTSYAHAAVELATGKLRRWIRENKAQPEGSVTVADSDAA